MLCIRIVCGCVCGVEIETKAWSCAVPNDTDAIP